MLFAVWWLACLIWSSVWLFVKLGVTDVPPVSFAGLRLVLALVLLSPVIWIKRREFARPRRDYLWIAWTGFLLLGINYALVFWGTQFIASGTTATLQAATPAFGMLYAAASRAARVTLRQVIGAAIGIAGVATVSANQLALAGTSAILGSLAVAGGAACVAIAYTQVKVRIPDVPPIVILAGQMLVGCVALLTFGAFVEGNPMSFHWTRPSVTALIYLAIVGSIAGFGLNLWLLRRMTASSVLAMSIVEPLLAVALGAAVLHERLHALTAVGAALILVSVWLVVVSGAPAASPAGPPAAPPAGA